MAQNRSVEFVSVVLLENYQDRCSGKLRIEGGERWRHGFDHTWKVSNGTRHGFNSSAVYNTTAATAVECGVEDSLCSAEQRHCPVADKKALV